MGSFEEKKTESKISCLGTFNQKLALPLFWQEEIICDGFSANRHIRWYMFFFPSMYSIGLHNAAYVRPEKYWLVCAGLLANNLFNLNFNFFNDCVPAVVD
jgi:hypothetical protein